MTPEPMKVLFLFPGRGRMDRVEGQNDGSAPREFFYGMQALGKDGCHSQNVTASILTQVRREARNSLS